MEGTNHAPRVGPFFSLYGPPPRATRQETNGAGNGEYIPGTENGHHTPSRGAYWRPHAHDRARPAPNFAGAPPGRDRTERGSDRNINKKREQKIEDLRREPLCRA